MAAKVGVNTSERIIALPRMTDYDIDESLVTRSFLNGPFQPDVAHGNAAEAKVALDEWLSTQGTPNDFVA